MIVNLWAVPWNTDEVINVGSLAVATGIVVAVPVLYGLRANLRDPLARAVLFGTGATAVAFLTSLVATLAFHSGWNPPESTLNWLARLIYVTVAFGKLLLLLALLKVLREEPGVSRNLHTMPFDQTEQSDQTDSRVPDQRQGDLL